MKFGLVLKSFLEWKMMQANSKNPHLRKEGWKEECYQPQFYGINSKYAYSKLNLLLIDCFQQAHSHWSINHHWLSDRQINFALTKWPWFFFKHIPKSAIFWSLKNVAPVVLRHLIMLCLNKKKTDTKKVEWK